MENYDVVILKSPLNEEGVPVGSKGVILMVFETPSRAFEVEFFDAADTSLGTFTCKAEQIEKAS